MLSRTRHHRRTAARRLTVSTNSGGVQKIRQLRSVLKALPDGPQHARANDTAARPDAGDSPPSKTRADASRIRANPCAYRSARPGAARRAGCGGKFAIAFEVAHRSRELRGQPPRARFNREDDPGIHRDVDGGNRETPRSSAFCEVHLPVPFCPAVSRMTSTSGLPVSASFAPSTAR